MPLPATQCLYMPQVDPHRAMDAHEPSGPPTGSQSREDTGQRLAQHVAAAGGVHHDIGAVSLNPADIAQLDGSAAETPTKQDTLTPRVAQDAPHPVQRPVETSLCYRFDEVVTGRHVERPCRVLRMRCHEHHVPDELSNRRVDLEAIEMGHLNVEKYHRRPQRAHILRHSASIRALSNDFEVGGRVQELAQPLPREGFVIDEEYAMARQLHVTAPTWAR